ncbi:MAG: tRNA-dihydrouridine synthase family protein, partial [Deltaproteobacteria bacterium]|nr:tRNA-dihydrouridine synthase family protein [Deltaproteobacteria bacterium]
MSGAGSAAPRLEDAPPIGRLFPWLAPLAGHTDLAFRALCREQGAAVACTEMVSAKGLVYGEERKSKKSPCHPAPGGQTRSGVSATRGLLRTSAADQPLVVQLFGEDPGFLGRAVELLRDWGFGWFDLNLGCSVPKVVKTGAGAALARSIPAALAAARAMLEAAGPLGPYAIGHTGQADETLEDNSLTTDPGCGFPAAAQRPRSRVGFKIRLGWSREEENYLELASELEQCGAGWLTLHPRYARQGFGGRADGQATARRAGRLGIPLLLSGDLFDGASALERLDESGAAGLMFARGALHNPAIFRDYLELAGQRSRGRPRAAGEPAFLRSLIMRHAELSRQYAGETDAAGLSGERPATALLKMRGAVPRYLKDLPGSRALRLNLSTCRNW